MLFESQSQTQKRNSASNTQKSALKFISNVETQTRADEIQTRSQVTQRKSFRFSLKSRIQEEFASTQKSILDRQNQVSIEIFRDELAKTVFAHNDRRKINVENFDIENFNANRSQFSTHQKISTLFVIILHDLSSHF